MWWIKMNILPHNTCCAVLHCQAVASFSSIHDPSHSNLRVHVNEQRILNKHTRFRLGGFTYYISYRDTWYCDVRMYALLLSHDIRVTISHFVALRSNRLCVARRSQHILGTLEPRSSGWRRGWPTINILPPPHLCCHVKFGHSAVKPFEHNYGDPPEYFDPSHPAFQGYSMSLEPPWIDRPPVTSY